MEKEKKMYWKNGFYDCPVEGSVEITVEYWKALLDGQASGKEIKENVDGYPVLVEHEFTLDELKGMKIAEINAYDKSDSVNSFTLTGKKIWLDKETRVGLVNSIGIEKEAGRIQTTLWYNAEKYVIPVDDSLAMLNQLELYALDCYNVTQSHIAAVKSLSDAGQVEAYNYKTGYPEQPKFVL
ncbi:DUF4376 domain-containing protein [Bacteroides congonensis]